MIVSNQTSQPGRSPVEPTTLSARRRRKTIRQSVENEGFVSIDDLANSLDVSAMTIHRDLDALQEEGWLRKVRGGATAKPSAHHHGDIYHRSITRQTEKRAIAATAKTLVQPEMSVILDDSTTALALGQLLGDVEPLTVVTNFLATANVVAKNSSNDLILLGGQYYPAYDAFLGQRVIEASSSLRADIVFMSTTAITDGSCYHQSHETVAVKQALLDSADKRVLLVDHSKFERNGLHLLTTLDSFDTLIIDAETPKTTLDELAELDVEILIATS